MPLNNNLQLTKYVPPKTLSYYGIPAFITLFIYSYINDCNPIGYLNTYYGICINTCFKPTPDPLAMITVLGNNIDNSRYHITLDNINKRLNKLGNETDIEELINIYKNIEIMVEVLGRKFNALKVKLTANSLVADNAIYFNLTEYKRLLDSCRNYQDNLDFMNNKLSLYRDKLVDKHNDIAKLLGQIDYINYYYSEYMTLQIQTKLILLERTYDQYLEIINDALRRVIE